MNGSYEAIEEASLITVNGLTIYMKTISHGKKTTYVHLKNI